MLIRPAKFSDATALASMSEDILASSKYDGTASIQLDGSRSTWQSAIANMATPVFIAEMGDELVGVIVGAASPLYQCLDRFLVSDLLWYTKPGVNARAAQGLLTALEEWAEASFDGKAIVQISVHDAIGDPDLAARFLKRRGYRVTGYILEKE